ncbi:MAG: TonB-dependent receptor, partial [Bacteroidia bacterium]|nr:TonB-dependent receptor [Bacteroidia bacterium]
MIKVFKFLSIVILCCSFQLCTAQNEWDNLPWIVIGDSTDLNENPNAILTGWIKIKGTEEPVSRASISLELFKYFDYTNQFGEYYLEMPKGKYRLLVRHVGMKAQYHRVNILSNGVLDIELEPGSTILDEIVISSRPIDSNIKGSLSGITKLSIQEVKTLPTLMGEVDILKSLQLMPGVSSVGEGSSGFNVRGGRTDQNLVLLNDVPIFNTSHALGFISAFNQDVVNDFSLYKGNVPANFGGRASSVLEVTTRRGDFEKWKYQGGVGPISSRFTAEGPIKTGKTSLLLAGRTSYSNWVLKTVRDPNVKKSLLSFYDAFTSLNHRFSANSTADVTYYTSKDFFQFSNQFGYTWDNSIVNAKWRSFSNRKASPVTSFSYGHFKNTLFDPSGVEASQLSNTLNYFQFKETVNYAPDEKQNIVIGIESVAYIPKPELQTGYKGNPNIPSKKADKNNGIEFSVFANDDYQVSENFSFSAGLRYSHYIHVGAD